MRTSESSSGWCQSIDFILYRWVFQIPHIFDNRRKKSWKIFDTLYKSIFVSIKRLNALKKKAVHAIKTYFSTSLNFAFFHSQFEESMKKRQKKIFKPFIIVSIYVWVFLAGLTNMRKKAVKKSNSTDGIFIALSYLQNTAA